MRKIVYVKYSNERDDRFKIKTVIEQDENGTQYVKKYALTEAAKAHIADIEQHERKLTQCAAGTKLVFNHCTLGDGYVDCEYVKGEPLSAILNRKMTQKDEDGALELIREYCDQLQKMATEPFVITDNFKQVFGKVEFSREQKSCKVTDIDLIFSNILVDGDAWNVIDLEWTFDFPVPVNYLIYRTIMNSEKDLRDSFMEKWDFWGLLQSEIQAFSQMDHAFLSYVRGNEVQLYRMDHLQTRQSIADLNMEIDEKKNEIQQLSDKIATMETSRSWRLTAPLRIMTAKLRANRYTHMILKGIKSLMTNGFRITWAKVKNKLLYTWAYKKAISRVLYTESELNAQRVETFPKNITISILVPLYNTPEKFLREMIQSVLDQTYANWELCLADGSDDQHDDVGRISMEYAKNDQRIRYKKLEKNMGISGNTNACIEMSSGDYIALFDHDDILHPAALHDVMKEICEQNADFVYTDEAVFESPDVKKVISIHHKPEYALDNLRANNYICHLNVFHRDLLEKAGGGFRAEYDGSQDHDLMLRLTANAEHIVRIPKVLYYWRSHPQSVAQDISAKTYAITAGRKAVRDSIVRSGYRAIVESSRAFPTIYRIKYALKEHPKVSIIIPSKDHVKDLMRCLHSIFTKTTYDNYEIVIVDNGSTEPETQEYYDKLKYNRRIVLCNLDIPFNFSKLNNYAVEKASGQYYIFLNNDTEVITPEWIEEMLMYVQREDVAAAGAMLYYPNDTIQHAGIILGLGDDRIAGNAFCCCSRDDIGYMGRLCYSQNMSAVTAACMMIKASVFKHVGGFDETFAVAYNDVDLCMRIRKAGYLIIWTPYAELYHYESKSRGLENTEEKMLRFQNEMNLFRARWQNELSKGDPYFNPNFRHDQPDFRLK